MIATSEQTKELALLLYQGKKGMRLKAKALTSQFKYPPQLLEVARDMIATSRGSATGRKILLSYLKQ